VGSSYYFLCASLPMLAFGSKPPMSNEDFVRQSTGNVTVGDSEILLSARLLPGKKVKKNYPALKVWVGFETMLRNEMVNFRSKKLGKDPLDYFRGEYVPAPNLTRIVLEASGEETPLEVERRIDTARWEKLEEIQQQHFFDLQFLVVYFLKLQILNKWDNMKTEKARKILRELLPPEKELKE